MTFKKLVAMLLIQRANFQTLHWKVVGEGFDRLHNSITNDYYEMVSGDIDDVVETFMRIDINPVGYIEACKIISTLEDPAIIYSTESNYNKENVLKLTHKSLNLILDSIASVLKEDCIQNDITNVGIKAYLESLYDKYDKECRFLNRKRIG